MGTTVKCLGTSYITERRHVAVRYRKLYGYRYICIVHECKASRTISSTSTSDHPPILALDRSRVYLCSSHQVCSFHLALSQFCHRCNSTRVHSCHSALTAFVFARFKPSCNVSDIRAIRSRRPSFILLLTYLAEVGLSFTCSMLSAMALSPLNRLWTSI